MESEEGIFVQDVCLDCSLGGFCGQSQKSEAWGYCGTDG